MSPRWMFAALPVMLFVGCAPSPAVHSPSDALQARGIVGDAYYLSECARCGGMLGGKGDTIDRVHAGRDVRFCSADCARAFQDDVDDGLRCVDDRMIEDQRPHYPLKTSIVSGAQLPESPFELILGNRLLRLANHAETDAVFADPTTFLQRLNLAVIEAQTPTYGMPTKCPVQGDILASDTPIDIVVANRMIRVCCLRCARVVRARPSQYLGMVDYSNREAAARKHTDPAGASP